MSILLASKWAWYMVFFFRNVEHMQDKIKAEGGDDEHCYRELRTCWIMLRAQISMLSTQTGSWEVRKKTYTVEYGAGIECWECIALLTECLSALAQLAFCSLSKLYWWKWLLRFLFGEIRAKHNQSAFFCLNLTIRGTKDAEPGLCPKLVTSITIYPYRIVGGLESIPADTEQQAGYTLDR